MNRLIFLILSLPALLLARPLGEKPNLIVIFTDDHGYADLSCQGILGDVRTPHIDALAAAGVRATNGYVTAPQCVPSRAGLLIGKHQNRFGVESNGMSLDGFNAEQTIAERLKTAGYATGQIGKWHLGPSNAITDHGFDDVFAKNANRPGWANYNLEGADVDGGKEDSKLYHIDACSEAAKAFIRRHSDEPFFLYLAYRAPHVPLDAPQKYLDRFPGEMPERRRQALAMLSAVDDGVGGVVDELKSQGLSENTLIFFIGDNGAPLKIHKADEPGGGPGWDGSLNDPMNGEKGMLTEGGLRVPFLVAWPGKIPGGQVYAEPLISLDVAATIVPLAGLTPDDQLDGVNILPFLTGEASGAPHEFLTWRWVAQSAVREGKWKLLRGGDREYLFDLETDPEESTNLLATNPETANRLRAQLESWASELDPPGLATGEMSTTWEDYFDYYLEGKPAPEVGGKAPSKGDLQGWVVRNGDAEIENGTLLVSASGKKEPFLAKSGMKVNGPAKARLKLKSEKGGRLGVAWRLDGQKDFPAEQKTMVDVSGASDWQDLELAIPADQPIIHLRVLLPAGESGLGQVLLMDKAGKSHSLWEGKDE